MVNVGARWSIFRIYPASVPTGLKLCPVLWFVSCFWFLLLNQLAPDMILVSACTFAWPWLHPQLWLSLWFNNSLHACLCDYISTSDSASSAVQLGFSFTLSRFFLWCCCSWADFLLEIQSLHLQPKILPSTFTSSSCSFALPVSLPVVLELRAETREGANLRGALLLPGSQIERVGL